MTTTVTHTIKTSGGDYSLLSTWEAAQQRDLVAVDEIAQAECYAGAYSDSVGVNGWTTGAANYIRIYTPAAERHDGRSRDVSGVGCQFTDSNTSGTYRVSESYVRVEGMVFRSTATAAAATVGYILPIDTPSDHRFTENIAFNVDRTGTDYVVGATVANLVLTFRNNIVYSAACRGIDTRGSTSVEISHCTFHGTGDFGVVADTELTCKNTYAGGYTTECFYTGDAAPGGSNNASSDTSASVDYTSSLVSKAATDQFVNITAGSENFHLKAGSALEAAGTPLAAVPLDIDGNTRSGTTPDIGADEFVAAPAEAVLMGQVVL